VNVSSVYEILDYPAKATWREGIEKGREEGINNILSSLIQSGIITKEEAENQAKKVKENLLMK